MTEGFLIRALPMVAFVSLELQQRKKSLENLGPGWDLNPGLQIQSQLCLPLDQGLKKNA